MRSIASQWKVGEQVVRFMFMFISPCQNMVPILLTMQSVHQQSSQRIRYVTDTTLTQVKSLKAIYQILCSSFWSHKGSNTAFFSICSSTPIDL